VPGAMPVRLSASAENGKRAVTVAPSIVAE
jgi:hypothetical protein